jgi:hypothetical protein
MVTPQSKAIAQQHAGTKNAQNWLLSAIRLWGLTVLTLHLAAAQLPEESAWSIWPYTFLPAWLGWILALLAGALIIPSVSQPVLDGVQWLYHYASSFEPHVACITIRRRGWFTLTALLAGIVFWLARLRHLSWGDSYLLSVALSYPDLELRVIYNWQAPFTVFLHQRLWQFVADPLLGWSVENVYISVSIICGMVFVYVLLTFMARMGRDRVEMATLAGLILTTGSMQLFFGYVENYTVVSLALLITLFLAWRALQGEIQLAWPVLGLSMTNAFHPSTVFLWPGMWFLSWLCWKRGYIAGFWDVGSKPGPSDSRHNLSKVEVSKIASWVLQTALPPLLVGGSVLVLMESGGHGLPALLGDDRPGGGDGIWFVPLFAATTQWQHYTMFSAAHLLDWSNVHFLISSFGLPLLAMALVAIYRFQLAIFNTETEKDYAYFLGVTATMYLLLTWLWNPDYGGRKDWDLFAPSAFVYTLLAGHLFVRILSTRQILKEGGVFIIAVSMLHTAAWIFTNTHDLPRG